MTPRERVQLSKYLSLHLRHRPEELGLALQPGGWVSVDELLAAAANNGHPVSVADLREVVATSDKQRFSFDVSGTRIRANQGHSVGVDLQLAPRRPPPVLFHGTSERARAAIQNEGLCRMDRDLVHLSPDVETARRVGGRHGRPVVFAVESTRMFIEGFTFFRSDNGVWLVDAVPPQYLRLLSPEETAGQAPLSQTH